MTPGRECTRTERGILLRVHRCELLVLVLHPPPSMGGTELYQQARVAGAA